MQGIGHVYIYAYSDLSSVQDTLPDDLAPYVLSGRATVVHWPSTGFCEDQIHKHNAEAKRTFEACAMDVHAQQWAYNHYLQNYGEYSNFTVIQDVDEFMSTDYTHGNLLSTMEHLEQTGVLAKHDSPYVNARYNIWLKNHTSDAMAVEKFYRYCYDEGFGKLIVWNKKTWSINLHNAEGISGHGDSEAANRYFRTHHLRNGKHNDEVFKQEYCKKSPEDRQSGPNSINAAHFGWIAPCMKRLLSTNATTLPEDCTIAAMLKAANVVAPIKWTP